MTKEEAIAYCGQHRNEFLSNAYAMGEDGQRQYDCLITCIEGGTIKPEQLADYGMEYETPNEELTLRNGAKRNGGSV